MKFFTGCVAAAALAMAASSVQAQVPANGISGGAMIAVSDFDGPYERPYGGGSLALGYQNEAVRTVTVDLAFDAVMVRNDGLTQASILASAKRQQAKSAAR